MRGDDQSHHARGLEYRHVDVFADAPFAANGLIVVFGDTRGIRAEALVCVTAELRQFELIVVDVEPEGVRIWARIFTAQEEFEQSRFSRPGRTLPRPDVSPLPALRG